MGVIWTLAMKDVKLLLRDTFALFWILAFPLIFSLFFGALFGGWGDDDDDDGGGDIPIAIVDEDRSDESAKLVERLADHESLRIWREGEDGTGAPVLSELEEAQDAVRKGRRAAYVRIPAGYGEQPFSMFAPADDGLPSLEVGIDPSRSAEAGLLQGVMVQTMFGGLSDRFTDKDAILADIAKGRAEIADEEDLDFGQKAVLQTFMLALEAFVDQVDMDVLAEGPGGGGFSGEGLVEVVDVARDRSGGPRSPFEITIPSGILWGLMSVSMGFAIMIVRERTQGTLLRLRVAPLTRAQLLAGKGLACFLACMGVIVVLLLFGTLALGITIGSVPLLALAIACTAACFTGLAMTASVLGKTEQAVAGTSWGLMMPFAMVGGGMIPLIAMPPWLITASHFSPFKWGIYALEGAVWRGFTAADMLLPCGILVGSGALFFVIGVAVFSRLDR